MAGSIYIHIPFCYKKCRYCTFISIEKLDLKEEYLKVLLKEINENYQNEPLQTIYIGGGTPSLLKIEEVKRILEPLNYDDKTEITFELNPDNITKYYLKDLKSLGINRLSIGVQVFDDEILRLIGRSHTSQQAMNVIQMAKEVGFKNISIDLIYGLPNQFLSNFEHSVDVAIKLDVQHISLYGLKIEHGCFFFKNKPKSLPDDNMQVDMYKMAIEKLTKNNFGHYEISNFAKPGFESKHNLVYWENKNYYGFGLSASGYLGNTRYTNYKSFEKYVEDFNSKEVQETLSAQNILEEKIFLGLRKLEGLNVKEIEREFGINFDEKYDEILKKYLDSKHLIKTEIGYKLSIEGILVSNDILCEFID